MKWFIINTACASIHRDPSFNSSCISEAIYGESCSILEKHKNWYKIKCEDEYEGWVNSFYGIIKSEKNKNNYLITLPDVNGSFTTKLPFGSLVKEAGQGATKIKKTFDKKLILSTAKTLIDVPYKWGGKSSLGFDCSGFVQAVLKACGLNIPRDAYQQFDYFKNSRIKFSDVLPGDLHFFGETNNINHVGFSLGSSEILHSQGAVRIEDLKNNQNLSDIYHSSISIQRKFIK